MNAIDIHDDIELYSKSDDMGLWDYDSFISYFMHWMAVFSMIWTIISVFN